jgi:hypothetical protein
LKGEGTESVLCAFCSIQHPASRLPHPLLDKTTKDKKYILYEKKANQNIELRKKK